jgi:hypothetical protein
MKITIADKFIAWLALLSGLTISSVAIWYSVAGLVSIFAAAVTPIIVMGVALEVSKLIATVWLKLNWSRAPIFIRTYLLAAIAILMVITSMGIFGFLSKAHSDQNLVSGDVQSKIAIYDEKIQTAKDNIDANRKALKQMDEAVDQVMGRSSDEKGADKAVAIRRGQQKERARLQSEIASEQKAIAALNEEAAPIRAEVRKVEAEVGPIKYIAAFIYGSNPDANILEKAVTWVIIIIVSVFDPLAVILLLASQYSFQWFRKDQEEESNWIDEQVEDLNNSLFVADVGEKPTAEEKTAYEPDDGPLTEGQIEQIKEDIKSSEDEPIPCYKCGTPLLNAPGIGLFCPNKQCDVVDGPFENSQMELDFTKEVETETIDPGPEFEGVKIEGEWVQTGPKFDNEVSLTQIEKELDFALSADATTLISNVETETANQQYVKEVIDNINPGAGIDHDSGAGIDHDSVEIHESGHDDIKGYIQNSEQKSSSLWSQITDKKTN